MRCVRHSNVGSTETGYINYHQGSLPDSYTFSLLCFLQNGVGKNSCLQKEAQGLYECRGVGDSKTPGERERHVPGLLDVISENTVFLAGLPMVIIEHDSVAWMGSQQVKPENRGLPGSLLMRYALCAVTVSVEVSVACISGAVIQNSNFFNNMSGFFEQKTMLAVAWCFPRCVCFNHLSADVGRGCVYKSFCRYSRSSSYYH
jgi:hypothetical protein